MTTLAAGGTRDLQVPPGIERSEWRDAGPVLGETSPWCI